MMNMYSLCLILILIIMAKKSLIWLACGVVAVGAAVVGYVYREAIGEKATELKGQIAQKMKRNTAPEHQEENTAAEVPVS